MQTESHLLIKEESTIMEFYSRPQISYPFSYFFM